MPPTHKTKKLTKKQKLFFGKIDLHGSCGSYLETLEGVSCCCRLHLILELHKGNVMTSWHQPHLLEARELVEQHAEHHLVGLRGEVGQEENLVRRSIVNTSPLGCSSSNSPSPCLGLLGPLLEGSLDLRNHVRVTLGIVDPHWFVIEWK